jgi:hypothetical protein
MSGLREKRMTFPMQTGKEERVEQSSGDGLLRLIAALPPGEFVDKPEEIDRFLVRLWPDGRLYFKGSRARIEEFLLLCIEMGLDLQVDYVSLCG